MQKPGRSKRQHLPTKINRHIPYIRNVKIHAGEKLRPFQLTSCLLRVAETCSSILCDASLTFSKSKIKKIFRIFEFRCLTSVTKQNTCFMSTQ